MMHQAGVLKASVCAVAVSVVATVYAQDNAQPAAEQAAPAAGQAQAPARVFDPLVRILNIQGSCEVMNPDVNQFQPAQGNKAYPLGSAFRTSAGSAALLVFSAQETVQLTENTEVVVGAPEKKGEARFVRLLAGKIKTTLRDTLPEGCFSVETPNAGCRNLAGRGDFTLSTDGTVETFQAATITGSGRIEGLQYQIPALRAANTVNIQTAPDRSLSRLTSVSGDFPIILETGTETPVTFSMSPKAVVKIWRENAPVGGRSIISTLVVSPTGKARHRFAYAEGRPNLATGELIAAAEGEESEKEDLPVLLTKEAPKADEQKAETTEKPAEDAAK